jgi:hypothetical protein
MPIGNIGETTAEERMQETGTTPVETSFLGEASHQKGTEL